MKERPILFSAPMVKAILDGSKKQPRRIVNRVAKIGQVTEFQKSETPGYDWIMRNSRMLWNDLKHADLLARCPYGQPGDHLWVREKHQAVHFDYDPETGNSDDWIQAKPFPKKKTDYYPIVYAADWYKNSNPRYIGSSIDTPEERGFSWRPSIHMPRWASRITLEIVSGRVERLQEISAKDSISEGLTNSAGGGEWMISTPKMFCRSADPITVYRALWEQINGLGSWEKNPWVWVIEFKRVAA
ncbi:MAG: hypothetical protein KKH22_02380 [Proteobacteria bacterium]|nr:hypothetical protein [Pseudomonadota bacterium]